MNDLLVTSNSSRKLYLPKRIYLLNKIIILWFYYLGGKVCEILISTANLLYVNKLLYSGFLLGNLKCPCLDFVQQVYLLRDDNEQSAIKLNKIEG